MVVLGYTIDFLLNSHSKALHVNYVGSYKDSADLHAVFRLILELIKMSVLQDIFRSSLVLRTVNKASLDHYMTFLNYSLLHLTI